MNSAVSLSRNSTSDLCHHQCCASSDGTFYNFSVTLNVEVNYARNYENLLNFVKVMPKILVVLFFSGHGIYTNHTQKRSAI